MAIVTRTTRLDAVNRMLSGIGEAPVTSLAGTLPPDALRAVSILDEIDLETQSRGWHFNTEFLEFAGDAGGKIAMPEYCVRVTVDKQQYPWIDITTHSDNGTFSLYDRQNNTFVIGSSLWVTAVTLTDFEYTPEAYRRYVTIRACRVLADRFVGDQARHMYTLRDEMDAYRFLEEHEGFAEQRTIFDGFDAARPLLRQYPVWGGGPRLSASSGFTNSGTPTEITAMAALPDLGTLLGSSMPVAESSQSAADWQRTNSISVIADGPAWNVPVPRLQQSGVLVWDVVGDYIDNPQTASQGIVVDLMVDGVSTHPFTFLSGAHNYATGSWFKLTAKLSVMPMYAASAKHTLEINVKYFDASNVLQSDSTQGIVLTSINATALRQLRLQLNSAVASANSTLQPRSWVGYYPSGRVTN